MNELSPSIRNGMLAIDSRHLQPVSEPALDAISIVGLGYVGAVSSACFSSLGHRVVGVDVDASKVASPQAGQSPIIEEDLERLIGQGRDELLLSATTDLADAVRNTDMTMVCVGTPTLPDGNVHLGYLEQVADQIGEVLRDKDAFHTVVIRSTIALGVTRNVVLPRIEAASNNALAKFRSLLPPGIPS